MNQLKTQNVKLVDVQDWNNLVINTYKKPYDLQQQYTRKNISFFQIEIPISISNEDILPTEIKEDGSEFGVQFQSWLKRDPSQPVNNDSIQWHINIWWEQNFYPSIYTLANDLFKKGLLEEATYLIEMN